MRQLSLLSLICNLPNDPLHQHGLYALTVLPPSSQSWFHQVRDLCLKYQLPHPLTLLNQPIHKVKFKKLVKLKVTEYWQYTLATECSSLPSLKYFDPWRASLLHPHPLWTSTVGNSYETCKSTVLGLMISGRYRTEMLCRYWSDNRSGQCLADTCHGNGVPGDIEHLLVTCPALEQTRHRLHSLWCVKSVDCLPLHRLIIRILGSPPSVLVRFILDCTSIPEVLTLRQAIGYEVIERLLYLTRTWAFTIHKEKLKILGRWPRNDVPTKIQPNNPLSATCAPTTCTNTFLFSGLTATALGSTTAPYSTDNTTSTSMTYVPIVSQKDQPHNVVPTMSCYN